jgi:hypothetical protein
MIHSEFGHGIVFIGWVRLAVGGMHACLEMQSRYFALLCSGKKSYQKWRSERGYQSVRHIMKTRSIMEP